MCFCRLKQFDNLLQECHLLNEYYFGKTNLVEVKVSVWTALNLDSLYKEDEEKNFLERFFNSNFWGLKFKFITTNKECIP
jgi:hypothetical protein